MTASGTCYALRIIVGATSRCSGVIMRIFVLEMPALRPAMTLVVVLTVTVVPFFVALTLIFLVLLD